MKDFAHTSGALYRVMDGVRRAKAAQMFGHTQIRAEVVDPNGQPMISAEHYPQALRALQRLIIHAKSQAYDVGQAQVAELLNDV